jgi:hypothetical protein
MSSRPASMEVPAWPGSRNDDPDEGRIAKGPTFGESEPAIPADEPA